MACPEWEKCSDFKCHDRQVCVLYSEYRRKIKQSKVASSDKKQLVRKKFKHDERCSGDKETCPKDTACQMVGQCVLTLDFVKANPSLLNKVSLCQTNREIINLFKKHNPGPMRSYYLTGQDRKKFANIKPAVVPMPEPEVGPPKIYPEKLKGIPWNERNWLKQFMDKYNSEQSKKLHEGGT